jgi:hypothetical protein
MKNNKLLSLYNSSQTVFDLKDLMKFFAMNNYDNCKALASYYVKHWYLVRLRQGIYAKLVFDPKELACKVYTPSYISFETVLYEKNIIFQSDSTLYVASYLSRTIYIPYQWKTITIQYRKLKDDILYDTQDIQQCTYYMQATWPRAKADMLYLKSDFYFDRD